MADIYKISLEDAASGNAYRIAAAYYEVSEAAKRMRNAVVSGDKAIIQSARGVQQLASNELRAARAAQSAGNAMAKLGPKVPTEHFKKGTKEGFKFSYMLNALANQAINLGFALVRNLASGLVSVASSLYDVADLATRAHMSFGNFFGGQAAGDRVLADSIAIAKRYGFTIEDVVAQMQRFGAAGFSAEQSKGTLKFGADMLAAGRSVQDVKGIFLAMTQIMGKGKLQAEELTQQLAERGINAGRVWQILGGILHKTVPEVMALQKAGKIGSGIALNAIVQAGVEGVHGGQIGKAGEKVADATVGGLGRRMSTLIESEVFSAVDKSTPALVTGMQSLFRGMDASTFGGLQGNLTSMLEGVGAFMEKIGPKIPAMVEGFTKAFGAASGFNGAGWQTFADSLPGVAANLGTIAGALSRIASALTSVLNPVDTMTSQRQRILSWVTGNGYKSDAEKGLVSEQAQMNMAGDMQNRKQGDDAIAEDMGRNWSSSLATGIVKGAPSIGKAAESAAQGAIDASKDTTQTHSPSKVFTGLGNNMSESLALGMDQSADVAFHSAEMMTGGAIAASAGASGLDSRRAVAAGSAAGASVSSSRAVTVKFGDMYFGGAGGAGGNGGDAMTEARAYFETEFVSMLERHLEGVGA